MGDVFRIRIDHIKLRAAATAYTYKERVCNGDPCRKVVGSDRSLPNSRLFASLSNRSAELHRRTSLPVWRAAHYDVLPSVAR